MQEIQEGIGENDIKNEGTYAVGVDSCHRIRAMKVLGSKELFLVQNGKILVLVYLG